MDVSVIIPAYNSGETLPLCLKAIFESSCTIKEVIVVDDSSSDNTGEVALNHFCKLITNKKNLGAGISRIIGEKSSVSEILIFIDSDVIVQKDTIRKIADFLTLRQDVEAVVGLFSKNHPSRGFFSNYKNLYMNFIFNRCPEEIDFIFGSIFGARRNFLETPEISQRFGEDTEAGFKSHLKGKKIILDKSLEVTHLKKYSLKSLLTNDFRISFHFTKIFLKHSGWNPMLRKKSFSHTRISQLVGIFLMYLLIPSIFFSINLSLSLLIFYLVLHLDFFKFILKEKGSLFTIKSAFFTCLDSFVMGLGILSGLFVPKDTFAKSPV